MIWEAFKNQFHESWWGKIKPFIESKECDVLYAKLKELSRRGKGIAPASAVTFRAFLETPLTELKVVILSYCPYHTYSQGAPVADGLAFSCSVTGKLQPSLEMFYKGLENDLYEGMNLNYLKNPDLTYMAHEGVLLWNAALTVEKDKAGSHQEIWEPFTKYVLENILAYTGIPIIFVGKDAAKYKKYVTPLTHGHIFEIEHPAYAARLQQDWTTNGVFKKVSRIVKQNNGYEIDWLAEKCPF